MDEEIINYCRQHYSLLIGERMAEEVKIAAGSAFPLEEEVQVVLRGRDIVTGLPKEVTMSSVEVREAISAPVQAIVDAVKTTLEITPPELVADLMDRGIVLAGGGSLLRGLDRRIAYETRAKVYVADDPLTCVVRGTGVVLEDLDRLRKVLVEVQTTRPFQFA
jgi:rod shape-determining protein MreB